ncbi:MAG: polynucleotide adenylyltransferase PcnB [Myxococcales bacterium]|nr:polynucleotide adenylyltransferase PcnB [Myxococcales bacterium]
MHIAHELIDQDAGDVVRRLSQSGYQAYLVGGCVRDLLLNRNPKDFDVSSSATPSEIKHLFRNCRIIGRRFRLAHIFFGSKIIETATFRANPRVNADGDAELLIHRDNVWGTDTEDALRRDFTINGLFYDVEEEIVIDHVEGMADLRKRLIRTIGEPGIRFQEDPVRMLRAIKFAARLGFSVEDETYCAILVHRADVSKCSQPRVLEELYRLLRGGASRRSIELLSDTGIISVLSQHLATLYQARTDRSIDWEASHAASASDKEKETKGSRTSRSDEWSATWAASNDDGNDDHSLLHERLPPFVPSFASEEERDERMDLAWNLLGQLDRLVAEERSTSNALALSATVAAFVVPELLDDEIRPSDASDMVQEVLQPLISELGIARRDAEQTRQILLAQKRLAPSQKRRGKPMALVNREYFDEALVLYEIMAAARGEIAADLDTWRGMQREAGDGHSGRPERKRRRGGRRRSRT